MDFSYFSETQVVESMALLAEYDGSPSTTAQRKRYSTTPFKAMDCIDIAAWDVVQGRTIPKSIAELAVCAELLNLAGLESITERDLAEL